MNRIGGQTSELLANSLLASETPNPVIDKKRINWLSIFKDGKVALCACHCIGCHLKQLKVDDSAGLGQTGHFQPLLNQTTNH